jgi:signal transduction histidine kinase
MARSIAISSNILLDNVYTDMLRIKMIISNLISNAIKYSDGRKPQMTISIKTMEFQNNIVIEVADNGIGIDKKHLEKIYDMFFVGTNTSNGSGLGLYILKQNVEKLNGRVEVQSEIHVGTKFTVFIPMVEE